MTTYTAEDFANAENARHPDGAVAARFGYLSQRQWRTEDDWLSDAEMADRGWVPVREAAAQPITLDALQAAWESAEQAEECGPGDVVIRPGEGGRYEVIPVKHGTQLIGNTRILHRASKPPRTDGAEELQTVPVPAHLIREAEEWNDAPMRQTTGGASILARIVRAVREREGES